MTKEYIDMREWLAFTVDQRAKLAEVFNIPKSGAVIVQTGVLVDSIVSDGRTFKDLESINITAMQEYLRSTETDFYKLMDKVLNKIEGIEEPTIIPETLTATIVEESVITNNEPIKNVSTKKKK